MSTRARWACEADSVGRSVDGEDDDRRVEKQAVPKERGRLDKETVTDEQQVSETARKEQIDIDKGRR